MDRLAFCTALALLTGCSVIVDGQLADKGGDGACEDAADGTPCGSDLICVDGECDDSACGDGYLDEAAGEACDDGNDIDFDGCDVDCELTCVEDAECDDGSACNGAETCAEGNVCAAGAPPGDGAACTLEGGAMGLCRADECVDPGCGNGVIDGTEPCDDGNEVDGDGCDVDCTFSCEADEECSDGSVCTGEESCDLASHTCVAGMPLECDDGDDCTRNECDMVEGCTFPLDDGDGDGAAPTSLGTCGTDCDDTDPEVYQGAEELCDGKDNNCNGDIDETAPTWYADCDDDGYAANTDGARTQCGEPPASGGCLGWTNVRPVDLTNTDCHDGNRDVRPNQTTYFSTRYTTTSGGQSWDYNCDGLDSRRYGCVSSSAECDSRTCTSSSAGFEDCGFFSPACGTSGDFSSCGLVVCLPPCTGGGCRRQSSTRTQPCR
ncbi:MAG: MopE-related protein [Sandaracinaceae bacterium]